MLFKDLKESDAYKNADDIFVCVNGEDAIDETYYPIELDLLPVIGAGYSNNGSTLMIDLGCSNWDDRYNSNWIAKS